AHPLGIDDLAVVVVAGGVFKLGASAFVKMIEGDSIFVGLQPVFGHVVLVVAGDSRNADITNFPVEEPALKAITCRCSANEELAPGHSITFLQFGFTLEDSVYIERKSGMRINTRDVHPNARHKWLSRKDVPVFRRVRNAEPAIV